MNYRDFEKELALTEKVMGIKRTMASESTGETGKGCSLKVLNQVLKGEKLVLSQDNIECSGGMTGFGLSDRIPEIPGGFGCFISTGKGEGFPAGERIKKNPELAEAMLLSQPQGVNDGYDALALSPYTPGEDYDLVSILASADQLAMLIHIYNFEKSDYDNVIMPMSSGCASLFRIPLGEMKKGDQARAVVGMVDVVPRTLFPADSFFFTVPARDFTKMLANADKSTLVAPFWKGVRKRIHRQAK